MNIQPDVTCSAWFRPITAKTDRLPTLPLADATSTCKQPGVNRSFRFPIPLAAPSSPRRSRPVPSVPYLAYHHHQSSTFSQMSTGIVTTASPAYPTPANHNHGPACPSCGTSVADLADAYPGYAQQRIADLEGQVRLLTEKASSAGTAPSVCTPSTTCISLT